MNVLNLPVVKFEAQASGGRFFVTNEKELFAGVLWNESRWVAKPTYATRAGYHPTGRQLSDAEVRVGLKEDIRYSRVATVYVEEDHPLFDRGCEHVLYWGEVYLHQVLSAQQYARSITGWFRQFSRSQRRVLTGFNSQNIDFPKPWPGVPRVVIE